MKYTSSKAHHLYGKYKGKDVKVMYVITDKKAKIVMMAYRYIDDDRIYMTEPKHIKFK